MQPVVSGDGAKHCWQRMSCMHVVQGFVAGPVFTCLRLLPRAAACASFCALSAMAEGVAAPLLTPLPES